MTDFGFHYRPRLAGRATDLFIYYFGGKRGQGGGAAKVIVEKLPFLLLRCQALKLDDFPEVVVFVPCLA